MISLVCSIFLGVAVTSSYAQESWQYDSDKYVSFKEKVELSWEYGFDTIDYFEIDKEVVPIKNKDLKNIIRYAKEKNAKQLIRIENQHRKDIDFDKKYIKVESKDQRIFIDTETPASSGEICYYQICAVVKTKNKKFGDLKSEPATLSIIRLHGIN